MDKKELEKTCKFIDDSARVSVGILCKRIEVLQKTKNLTPELYKNLVKELIYETSRNLKKLLEVYFSIGKVEFKPKNPSKK